MNSKERLIRAIQLAIVLYVREQEGSRYRGNNVYNLRYIENSRDIPRHRKRDIRRLDAILLHEEYDEVQLAGEIYDYLRTIQTGFNFWFIHIGNNSTMRNKIHDTIFRHDPALFEACKRGDRTYSRGTVAGEEAPLLAGNQGVDASAQYIRLRRDHNELTQETRRLRTELRDERRKTDTLSSQLKSQELVCDGLKRQVRKLVNTPSHNHAQGIEMTACPANDSAQPQANSPRHMA